MSRPAWQVKVPVASAAIGVRPTLPRRRVELIVDLIVGLVHVSALQFTCSHVVSQHWRMSLYIGARASLVEMICGFPFFSHVQLRFVGCPTFVVEAWFCHVCCFMSRALELANQARSVPFSCSRGQPLLIGR